MKNERSPDSPSHSATVLHCRNTDKCENNGTCVILEQSQIMKRNGAQTIREIRVIVGCECPEHVLGETCDTGKTRVPTWY